MLLVVLVHVCWGCHLDALTRLTRRGGVVGVGGGCTDLRSLFNRKFMLVFKKKERKRKKTYPGARDASRAPERPLFGVILGRW